MSDQILPPRVWRTRQLIFGLEIDALALPQVVALAVEAITTRKRLQVGVVNAAKIVKMQTDDLLRDSLVMSDVLLADGQSVVWASRVLHRPLPERVTGIDLFEALLDRANADRLRVYLLGATPEVLAKVESAIAARWPGVVVVGSADGYYRDQDAPQVAAAITRAEPDLLFLGMTTPRKEIFLATYGPDLGVPVLHGVGGSFDILAGVTRRAPRLWQRLGLEWAYRVLQEPGRLWRRYLVTNTVFLALLAGEVVYPRPPYKRTSRTQTQTHWQEGAAS